MIHIPVLTNEVLEYLALKPNENIIDGTVGQAGHSIEILQKNAPDGRLLGIDWDSQQIENSKLRLKDYKERVILLCDSYKNIQKILEKNSFTPVNGILLDLGYSSWQIEKSDRGFSFGKDELLDMRYSQQSELTAEKIVNEYQESELEKIFKEYGEEKFARQIAKNIVKERKIKKIKTTFQLVQIIKDAIPGAHQHQKIHFATRSFQALRIAVNGELDNLEKFLPQAILALAPAGRLVIISFHSLEDRIVKHFFINESKKGTVNILTKKPVTALPEEIVKNPRSRSAKLRAIVKV